MAAAWEQEGARKGTGGERRRGAAAGAVPTAGCGCEKANRGGKQQMVTQKVAPSTGDVF